MKKTNDSEIEEGKSRRNCNNLKKLQNRDNDKYVNTCSEEEKKLFLMLIVGMLDVIVLLF